jgi:hypothetical protein
VVVITTTRVKKMALVQIGAEGVGEAYKARDTKLDREVAIRVQPGRKRSLRLSIPVAWPASLGALRAHA